MDVTSVFGTGTTLDTTTPADPVLQIPFSALAAATGWDTAPTSGTDSGEKWLGAILLRAKSHLATITDESNDITVDDPFKAFTTRATVDKVGFSYNVTIYQPDLNGSTPDPDNL